MNEQLKFFKGKETSLGNINPQAGSIYHCEDTGNTYLANENSELEIYSNTFTFSAAEADATVPVNADTLNGKTADDFMTPIQVDDAINEAVENVAYISNLSSDSSLVLADAESLGGLPAENYATKNYVVDTINQAQLGGDNSEVDLSIYATKDDLTLVRNAIPTTPEAIGAEVSGAANNALNNAKIYVNEQINAIDFPVDSVNGKTGSVSLSAKDVGATKIVRLWKGATSGDFPAQTINIGKFSQYSYIGIIPTFHRSGDRRLPMLFLNSGGSTGGHISGTSSSDTVSRLVNDVDADAGTISFSAGYKNGTADSKAAIPYIIVGFL